MLKMTAKGLALLGKQQVGTAKPNVTRVVAGTGYVDPAKLEEQVAVSEPIGEMEVGEIRLVDGKIARLPVQMSNLELTETKLIRQVGVYSQDPDEGEILYELVQYEDPVPMPSYMANNGGVILFDPELDVLFANGELASVPLTPGFLATLEKLREAIEEHDGATGSHRGLREAMVKLERTYDAGTVPPADNQYILEMAEAADIVEGLTAERLELERRTGALERKVNGWSIFDSHQQLGMTPGEELDIGDIIRKMPDKSIFLYGKPQSNTSAAYPTPLGLLEIKKVSAYRATARFDYYGGTVYRSWKGAYRTDLTPQWSGWRALGPQSGTWTPEFVDADGNDDATYSLKRGKWLKTGILTRLEIQVSVTDAGSLSGSLFIPLPPDLYKQSPSQTYPQSVLRASNLNIPDHAYSLILDTPDKDKLRPTFYIRLQNGKMSISTVTGEQLAESLKTSASITFHGAINYIGV